MKSKGLIVYIFPVVLMVCVVVFFFFCNNAGDRDPFKVEAILNNRIEKMTCLNNTQEECYVFLPGYLQMEQVRLCLDTENPIYIDGIQVVDGMNCSVFLPNKPYSFSYTFFGKQYDKSVTFIQLGETATVYMDTESKGMDKIHMDKDNKETGQIRIYGAGGTLEYSGNLESISGRGNTTWTEYEKKPYNLTLSEEADLLGMGKAQKWILLANAADYSHVRNKLVLDFAESAGLAYTPEAQWVDLFLNGEYAGLYLLCERNEVHLQRVNVSGEGSFLVSLEAETRLLSIEDPYFATENKQALRVHYSTVELDELSQMWQSVEDALLAKDGKDPDTGKTWQELIDVDSWARKYLIEELFGNMDACYLSQYFYYDGSSGDGKIYAGPVWDYDLSVGMLWQAKNPQAVFANRLEVKQGIYAPWFYALCQKDEFKQYVSELYETEFMPLITFFLEEKLPRYFERISASAFADWLRWKIPQQAAETEMGSIGSYLAERVDFLQSYLVEEKQFYFVRVDGNTGVNYVYQAVEPGECLLSLPIFVEDQFDTFVGWYYEGTDIPIDPDKPIYEDIAIQAKWNTPLWFRKIKGVIPLGVCAVLIFVMFVSVLAIDIKRWRKYG